MGNSGSPSFLLIGNELVFLCSRHAGYKDVEHWAKGWGPVAFPRLSEIQNKIDELEHSPDNPYRLNVFDMNGINETVNRR